MKSLTKITLLAAGLAVAAIPFVNAAKVDAKAAARADKQALAGKHPLLRAAAQRQALKQRIAKRLDLSADQISQLKAKRADVAASIKSIRSDTSLTPEQRRAKVREAIQSALGEARGTLNADQKAKAGKMRETLRERLKARRGL